MTHSLILQHTYESVEIALCRNEVVIAQQHIHKIHASKELVPHLKQFLHEHNLDLKNISFIGVNEGPGPFTTLRVVIATVNGMAFSAGIPLVGVNGLTVLVYENEVAHCPVTCGLLNAYHKDVYFGLQQGDYSRQGCAPVQEILNTMANLPPLNIHFVGNGASMYQQEIIQLFGKRAFFSDPIPQGPSIDEIAFIAYAKWQVNDVTQQIVPLYLKQNMVSG